MLEERRRRLAALLRPELPGLVDEITREIRRVVPEYGRPLEELHGGLLRERVQYAVRLFADLVEYPQLARGDADRRFRDIGRAEGHAGRTLDQLHAALRTGGRVAWRRVARIERQRSLPAVDVSWLADRLFVYLDELASLSAQGYREARVQSQEAGRGLRRRLLRLILQRPPVSRTAVADLARTVGWPVPEQCALVAVEPEPGTHPEPDPALEPDVLADLRDAEPCLLVPGPVTSERLQRLSAAMHGARLAVGPTVPLADASASLRWARQGLRLVGDGVLPDAPVTVCADHWAALWLLSDPALVKQVTKRRLAPLNTFPPKQRARLAGTLFAWLQAQGNVQEAAVVLRVHPRTVRYRMRQIEDAFGPDLRDPTARFEIEAALRAVDLLTPHEHQE
ncbi:PucR C-terminal helix-turn-helix domain-containing protein [Amycolatopsis sacchari]|uniref:PucR C-terminal helix-turn-helix domain-containing protein n=1 Tax=Amycolatopsis sacchari TaxID=115433 RepID=A0A1I3XH71_9PSEU|nr:PucR family transcriptional regulator [Amycolatopsis sacchari]SFK18848.1 PucR C-terminal helix-turn-helix domain-containing protein [Amycolatopsis sacchari]